MYATASSGAERLAEYMKTILRNSVLLKRRKIVKEPPLGTSKIGGIPHLPAGFEWPYYEAEDAEGVCASRPLSFIAQIDLASLSDFDRDGLLSASGYLYFFYDLISMKWGFDPKDEGSARVYYFDVTADRLCKTSFPDDLVQEAQVPLSRLSFKTMDELPYYEEFVDMTDVEQFGEGFDWDGYDEAVGKTIKTLDCSPDEVCKVLGYADLLQDSMPDECARVTAGLYCGSPEGYESISQEQKAAIAADARNWILLAQFGTLSEEIMFGDCGCIYFYIRKDDLKARRFDRVWLCLQCG